MILSHFQDSPVVSVTLSEAGISVLGAGGDADAVAMWLRARGSRSKHTALTYGRVSKRLLLWLAKRQLMLPQMTVAQAQEHLDALRHPDVDLLIPRGQDGALAAALHTSQSLKKPMSDKGICFTRTVLSQLCHSGLTTA